MEAGIANSIGDTCEQASQNEQTLGSIAVEITIEPRKQRERRQKSPSITTMLLALEDPANASTSGLAGQTVNDTTFEPTIDMMVNDFDDEQTLNEEEALAASEQQDPQDEIATLKEESEMPLEELLAKYQSMPRSPMPSPPPRKKKKLHKRLKTKQNNNKGETETEIIACAADEDEITEVIEDNKYEANANGAILDDEHTTEQITDATVAESEYVELVKPTKKSYLHDLYPDENFNEKVVSSDIKEVPLDALYGEEDVESESEDEIEADADYVKKTIMVGSAYQATIPSGLSQYGDVLPYENEDKLIWEPSQVSEREVEEYLLMARDIKPTLCEDEATASADNKSKEDETDNSKPLSNGQETNGDIVPSKLSNGNLEHESGNVVKDNEQALHLLVQCGYDFKEALRRKRLNAMPLTGSMSIWSEEECQKFEEGIQKFGKDFLRIRQNQVRTRSMRELVLFYYLWKKSERRDHEFANADTVDHMDIYLNESGDFSGTNATNSACHTAGSSTSSQNLLPMNARGRAHSTGSSAQKNISIMTVSQSQTANAPALGCALKASGNRKRSAASSNINQLSPVVTVNSATNDNDAP